MTFSRFLSHGFFDLALSGADVLYYRHVTGTLIGTATTFNAGHNVKFLEGLNVVVFGKESKIAGH